MNSLYLAVFVGAVGLGIFVLVWQLLGESARRRQALELRIAHLAEDFHDVREAELAKPFSERIIRPFLDNVGKRLSKGSSKSQIADIERDLTLLRHPWGLTAGGFLAVQLVLPVMFLVVGVLLTRPLDLDPLTLALGLIAVAIMGYLGPRLWLRRAIAQRKEEILDTLPSALDLLTISVEAGLSLDAAIVRVTEKYRNALADELVQLHEEMRLGRTRRDALSALAERVDIDEMSTFVQAINQSDQMGTSLATTLRIQSEEMRRRRRQRAEEKGAKAPIKMLFPMACCIFPSLFIVILGPAVLTMTHTVFH